MVTLIPLAVKDAYIIEHPRFHDERGYLNELLNMEKFPQEITRHFPVLQNTVASSRKNVLRGIHISTYAKLMTCVRGSMYDFLVDLRPESPTYMKWCAVVLSDTNCHQLLVPPNCGHGYVALQDNTICVYCQGGCFGNNEKGISPFDPIVDMYYPIPEGVTPIVSAKDTVAPCLDADTLGVHLQPKRTRVLIIGASGQVGGALTSVFEQHREKYCIYGTYNGHPIDGAMPFDLERAAGDLKYCDMVLTTCRPHVVILCAAFTWVDGCENSPEKGRKLNTTSVKNLSQLAQSMNAKVVLYSTDYVFDGELDVSKPENWNNEKTSAHPVNKYGQYKLEAEEAAMAMNPQALVIRTSRVYGPEMQGKNFVYQVTQRLKEGQPVPCLTEEVSCPTYNCDLAEATRLLIEKNCSGVYHCAGPEAWSKYDWGLQTASYFGLDTYLIQQAIPSGGKCAQRPKMVAMNTKKLRDELPSFQFHTFHEALKAWQSGGVGKQVAWPAA